MSANDLGRRKRKKLVARSAILEASSALFLEHGFDKTRVETIAQRADVGVGTVYNHFATKAGILVAILLEDVGEVIVRTRAIVERGEPSVDIVVREALCEFFTIMERRPRNLWRDLIAHALADDGSLGAAYRNAENILRGIVHRALERLRQNGCLRKDIALGDAADVVFAIAKTAVYAFVFDRAQSATLLPVLERQLGAIF